MEVSQIVLEWQAKARAEGEARGRAEGEARGRADTLRSMLLQMIRLRLKAEPPADLVTALQTQTDPEALSRWFDQALLANGLDEFRKVVGPS